MYLVLAVIEVGIFLTTTLRSRVVLKTGNWQDYIYIWLEITTKKVALVENITRIHFKNIKPYILYNNCICGDLNIANVLIFGYQDVKYDVTLFQLFDTRQITVINLVESTASKCIYLSTSANIHHILKSATIYK